MASKIQITQLSRTLSWILRHGIIKLNLDMDNEGYVLLNDVLNIRDMKGYTVDDIRTVVESNDKERFKLIIDNGVLYIRANQGHSKNVGAKISDNKLLEKITTPLPLCIHGTTRKAYEIIKTSGLSPMGRKHVHLASGFISDGVKSGMRYSSSVIIHIDMEEAMKANITFYMSDNGVILTPDHIPCTYFKKVTYK